MTIPVPGLAILFSAVLVKRIDTHTERQSHTDAVKRLTLATVVGVSDECMSATLLRYACLT